MIPVVIKQNRHNILLALHHQSANSLATRDVAKQLDRHAIVNELCDSASICYNCNDIDNKDILGL